jgi:hypothetical protein
MAQDSRLLELNSNEDIFLYITVGAIALVLILLALPRQHR